MGRTAAAAVTEAGTEALTAALTTGSAAGDAAGGAVERAAGRAGTRRPLLLAATALAAGAVGTAGAAAAGLAARRRAARRFRLRPDPYAGEDFGSLRGEPVQVTTSDGTVLHAEIDDPDRTDLAIVFCHGWTLTQDSWHFQRRAMRGMGRLVFWDHRGHGRSGEGERDGYGLHRLARDLDAVIERTVPAGTPVVLVGHSMGGMTIMKYADEFPDRMGTKIVGAALVCTSPGSLNEVTLGLPALVGRFTHRLVPAMLNLAGARARTIEKVRRAGSGSSILLEDLLAFGRDAAPSTVALAERMLVTTRMEAMTGFLHSMITTELISDCAALGRVDTLVVTAEYDRLTPPGHGRRIAECVPSARLEHLPGSGHMAMLERPAIVSDHLTALVSRVHNAIAA
jgi:pimeloyl-ACP methyl ester carboxylesterase